jgi:hypothetical protein
MLRVVFRNDKNGKATSAPSKLCHQWVRCVGRTEGETNQGDRCFYTAHASCLAAEGIIEPVNTKASLAEILEIFCCPLFNHI